jgi:hypothetical protein
MQEERKFGRERQVKEPNRGVSVTARQDRSPCLMPESLQVFIDGAPVDWLLDGESFVRYRTLKDLLGKAEEDDGVLGAERSLTTDRLIKRILDRQKREGYWGSPSDIFKWWPKKDTTFWVLGVLADFGLRRKQQSISAGCEYVLSTQLSSGAFGWGPPATPGDCFTGILTGSLARSGCLPDPRVERAYEWLLQRQRLDGGFWCKKSGQRGGPREKEPSCAFGTLCVLGALTQNSDLRRGATALKAAHFLLECWDNRSRVKYAGHDSQIGRGWEKLKYPFTDYRVLRVLDVLSSMEEVRGDKRLHEMMGLVTCRKDDAGCFTPDSIHKVWSGFDFGQKAAPSRWLTLIVYRIAKRMV